MFYGAQNRHQYGWPLSSWTRILHRHRLVVHAGWLMVMTLVHSFSWFIPICHSRYRIFHNCPDNSVLSLLLPLPGSMLISLVYGSSLILACHLLYSLWTQSSCFITSTRLCGLVLSLFIGQNHLMLGSCYCLINSNSPLSLINMLCFLCFMPFSSLRNLILPQESSIFNLHFNQS